MSFGRWCAGTAVRRDDRRRRSRRASRGACPASCATRAARSSPARKSRSRTRRPAKTAPALTNEQGYFLVGSLNPRPTRSRSRRPASRSSNTPAMPVAVGQELTLDFELKPAGVQEAVTVVGTAPILDISSARLGVNVSEREVQELPVNGRQMSQLMLQAPGAQNAGTGTWQDVRFSGRANEQNVIKYDGIEGSAIIDASPGNVNGENQHAVQAAGQPRERPGVPRRVEQLPGRIRHRHRRPGERHHQVGRQPVPRRPLRVPAQRQVRRAELLRLDAQPRRQRDCGRCRNRR